MWTINEVDEVDMTIRKVITTRNYTPKVILTDCNNIEIRVEHVS